MHHVCLTTDYYSKQRVYMTHFYADLALIPISFVHVTAAVAYLLNFQT